MLKTKKVKIKEIGKVYTGSTPSTKDETMWGNDYPFVKPSDMIAGSRRVFETETRLSDIATKTAKGRLLPPGTTCVVCIGTIGKICQLHESAATNQQINSIVVDKDKFDPDYIYYLMSQSIPYVKVVEGGSASGREHVKKSTFEEIELEVLPLENQKKLGELLSNYDNLIENNNRRITILEDMAQSLYLEWFVKFRFPGSQDCTFIDSALGRIPEGWEEKCIAELGAVITGKTPSKANDAFFGDDVPFIKTPDMHDSMFVIHTNEALSFLGESAQKNKTIPAWSICVSCIGTIGVVSITAKESQTNQQINSLLPNVAGHLEFLFFYLKASKQELDNLGSSGATMGNVNKSKFEGLRLLKPTDVLIDRFHKIVRPMFSQILNLEMKNINLKQQRDMLLPKLILGMIEI